MSINKALFSSKTEEWETPQDLFDELDAEFHFDIDVCATPKNAKCRKYFTKGQDGLRQSWQGLTVWCNPPYGKHIAEWVKKCYEESLRGGRLLCYFLQGRTPNIFTIIFTTRLRYVLFVEDSDLAIQRTAHRFQVC